MPTPVREHVLAWVKTRLATIAGYTVKRNPTDDVTPDLPLIGFVDPPEDTPSPAVNQEYELLLEVPIAAAVRAAGAGSGETAATALNAALASAFNALMDPATWDDAVDDDGRQVIRGVQPGRLSSIEFLAGAEAAERIAFQDRVFTITYTTADSDAFDASP